MSDLHEVASAWDWNERRFKESASREEPFKLTRFSHPGGRDHDLYCLTSRSRLMNYLSRTAAIAAAHASSHTPLFEQRDDNLLVRLTCDGGLPDAVAAGLRRRLLRTAGPVGNELAELDTDLVGLDNADAVEQALDHLQQRGFRDILLVTEPLDGTSSRIERVQAFNASIGRRPALKGQVLQTDDFFRDGLRAFLSASGPGPKALFTCNGVATLCATRQLRDLGCRLFDEVGLLALDELDWYPLVGSGITALAQPTDEIGRTAFERLLARLEGDREPARRVTFPAQLIVRGSTHPRG